MTQPYVLTMRMPTGDANEIIIIEKTGWVGRGICFPREQIRIASTHGIKNSGVYFLLDDFDQIDGSKKIYIGEAENVLERLTTHRNDASKEFWGRTICFISTDNSLNKAGAKYVESKLLEQAKNAGTWEVINTNKATASKLSQSDEISFKTFMGTMLQILPVLGVNSFEIPVRHGSTKLFISGPEASGEGEVQSGGFLVYKDTKVRAAETATLSEGVRNLRKRLLDDGVLSDQGSYLKLEHDYLFSSPSAAAAVILARSANGRTEWKDINNRALKEIQEESD